jgi:hypothetical protein
MRLARERLGAATLWRAVRQWRFTLGTAALSLFLSAVGWRGEDYPAQELRIEIFRQGDWFWNPNWFGGHPTLGYSTLFPAVGALVGATGLGVLATTSAVGAFEALVRHRASASYATAAFAFGMVSNLVVGRLQFALGSALALAAVAVLSRSRIAAAVLAILTSLTSPLAALFLAIAFAAWALARRQTSATALLITAALVPAITTSFLFGAGGNFPFPLRSLLWSLALCVLAALVSTERMVRIGCALTAAVCLGAFLVDSPLGANVGRLPFLLAGPLLVLGGSPRTRSVLLAVSVAVAVVASLQATQIFKVAYATATDGSTHEAYYREVVSYLLAQPGDVRVEIPFTAQHWETAHVAEHIPIARGWERQIDRRLNPEFYDEQKPLDARIYHAWLLRNEVTHVALPDTVFDSSSAAEAQLIRSGLDYLEPVFRNRHWTVFVVEDSTWHSRRSAEPSMGNGRIAFAPGLPSPQLAAGPAAGASSHGLRIAPG